MAEDKEEHTRLEQGSSSSSSSQPHESLFYALSYLPLFELLSITRVCKSFRDAISNDIIPWLNIIVDRPLSSRLSDGILSVVVRKAKGRLQSLVLINCLNITDDGLLRVIAQNPHITKLHVPDCTSLSPAGLITAATLLSQNHHKVQSLKISGIYNIHKTDLQALRNLLNCPIDVDICPKCDQVRMILDCPRAVCEKKKQEQVGECRGCELCVPRCVECGVCVTGSEEPEEACCADILCLECWLKLPKCNFCNKPYCSRHADRQHKDPGSIGFICTSCHSKYVDQLMAFRIHF